MSRNQACAWRAVAAHRSTARNAAASPSRRTTTSIARALDRLSGISALLRPKIWYARRTCGCGCCVKRLAQRGNRTGFEGAGERRRLSIDGRKQRHPGLDEIEQDEQHDRREKLWRPGERRAHIGGAPTARPSSSPARVGELLPQTATGKPSTARFRRLPYGGRSVSRSQYPGGDTRQAARRFDHCCGPARASDRLLIDVAIRPRKGRGDLRSI